MIRVFTVPSWVDSSVLWFWCMRSFASRWHWAWVSLAHAWIYAARWESWNHTEDVWEIVGLFRLVQMSNDMIMDESWKSTVVLFDKLLMKVWRAKSGDTSALATAAKRWPRIASAPICLEHLLATERPEVNRVVCSTSLRKTIDDIPLSHINFIASVSCQNLLQHT